MVEDDQFSRLLAGVAFMTDGQTYGQRDVIIGPNTQLYFTTKCDSKNIIETGLN